MSRSLCATTSRTCKSVIVRIVKLNRDSSGRRPCSRRTTRAASDDTQTRRVKFAFSQQPRVQPVIKVVGVKGDFVSGVSACASRQEFFAAKPLRRLGQSQVVKCFTKPSWPSHARFDPKKPGYFCSSFSTMRRLWRLYSQPPCPLINRLCPVSPRWPNGEWPRS
jgi:hypothetical protein